MQQKTEVIVTDSRARKLDIQIFETKVKQVTLKKVNSGSIKCKLVQQSHLQLEEIVFTPGISLLQRKTFL